MDYGEARPSPSLRRDVECFWWAEDDAAAGVVERVLPDGCIELIFHLAETFRWWPASAAERQPSSFVVGQLTRYILIQPTGRVRTLGARFRPGGARPYLGVALDELTDRVTPLRALWGSSADDLTDALRERPARAGARLLDEALARRRRPSADDVVPALVGEILARGGTVRVDDLARRCGLSVRQLGRRFQDEVGVGPKVLCRIVRHQAALRARAAAPDAPWAELALDCGYYDQAHLAREFSALGGAPPEALRRDQGPLASQFTRLDRLDALFAPSDSSKTAPAISR